MCSVPTTRMPQNEVRSLRWPRSPIAAPVGRTTGAIGNAESHDLVRPRLVAGEAHRPCATSPGSAACRKPYPRSTRHPRRMPRIARTRRTSAGDIPCARAGRVVFWACLGADSAIRPRQRLLGLRSVKGLLFRAVGVKNCQSQAANGYTPNGISSVKSVFPLLRPACCWRSILSETHRLPGAGIK